VPSYEAGFICVSIYASDHPIQRDSRSGSSAIIVCLFVCVKLSPDRIALVVIQTDHFCMYDESLTMTIEVPSGDSFMQTNKQ